MPEADPYPFEEHAAIGQACDKDEDCPDSDKADGLYCRGDRRCSPKIFETVWRLTEGRTTIRLPHDGKGKCDFEILWGDETADPAVLDFSKAQKIKKCTNDSLTHRYAGPGEYRVRIRGIYDGWGQSADAGT